MDNWPPPAQDGTELSAARVTIAVMNYSFGDPRWSVHFDDPLERDDDPDDWWDEADEQAPIVNLTPVQQAALVVAVNAGLQERGCDNTLRASQHWAEGAGVDWPRLRLELQGNGGYCDCEILFNVFPADELEPD